MRTNLVTAIVAAGSFREQISKHILKDLEEHGVVIFQANWKDVKRARGLTFQNVIPIRMSEDSELVQFLRSRIVRATAIDSGNT